MQELVSTPETAQTNSAETSKITGNELKELGALLGGEEPSQVDDQVTDSEQSDASPEAGKSKGKPRNLDELAETLGVQKADLYDIQIPFDVGDDVEFKTLGEIKDSFRERDSIEVDRLTWEETKAKKESQLALATGELQELVSMLPKAALSQELLQAVARRRAQTQERETRLVYAVIPEWSDEKNEAADRDEMRAHMAQYGFPENALDSIYDHKTLAFIRAAAKRATRIERALAQVKTVRKPGHKPSAQPSKAPSKKSNSRRRSASSQVDAVAELLKIG